ncbi:MAG: ABC transporter permease [Bacteroides oleiciplenus]|nr:ABC transporter permease [Bacteroides oleiciplenus]
MKTLKYAWRFLIRSKSYTIINLLGLAFSLACCIILVRYIHRELTVDSNCIDREQVYGIKRDINGNIYLSTLISSKDSSLIDQRYINKQTSFIPLEKDYVMVGANRFPSRMIVTDSVFFQLFRYPIVQGNITLRSPQSALVTEAFARKLFGKENPVGKVIRSSSGKDVTIEGVLGNLENKTFLQFDVVLSKTSSSSWERMPIDLFSFMPGTDMNKLNKEGRNPQYVNSPESGDTRTYTYSFIPVRQLYWDTSITNEEPLMFFTGSYPHLLIIIGVCLLILLTGIINFINIYLVAMLRRGKEYGLKKVFGARGKELFFNIWAENTLLVSAAMLIAWLFIEISASPVKSLFNYHFVYTAFDWQLSLAILIMLPLITSVYPFIKYNYTPPIISIRSIGSGNRSVRSRILFLGIQYMLTFLLVVLSLYFNNQLDVLLNTEPGFRTKDIIIAQLAYESKDFSSYTDESMKLREERIEALDNELSSCPYIEDFEASYIDILKGDYGSNYISDEGKKVYLNMRFATPHFFHIYNIKLIEGELPNLEDKGFWGVLVVNRAAMEALGYTTCQGANVTEENPLQRGASGQSQPIVAVVDDYYGGHLSLGKKPTVYMVSNRMSGDVYQIACTPGKKKEVLDFLRKTELKIYGSEDFEYSILEEDVKAIYAKDRQIAIIYSVFACIAIAIASLGLFGISLFDIRQRYREITIRKVNGAQLKDLYPLLLRKYMAVLGVAFLLVIPLSWYIIHVYTSGFAVKAPVTIGIFIIGLVIVAVISLGTLLWQVRKAANINPAEIMKYE